ncbi:MAG: hypothetical protein ACKOWJ_00680 [Micrococcales bacterium]
MKRSTRIISASVIFVLVTLGLVNIAQVAYAADSVTVPGQVTVDQCPIGYQYSIGIEARIGVGMFTICNAPPTAEDLLRQAQDNDFQARIQAAEDAAGTESARLNAENPGQQICVQWGPILHANGVSQSSGGVCANVVQPSIVAPTMAPSATPSAGSSEATAIDAPALNNAPPVTTSAIKVIYSSRTKSVCKVIANKVVRVKAGSCVLQVTTTDSSGVKSSSLKKVVFSK